MSPSVERCLARVQAVLERRLEGRGSFSAHAYARVRLKEACLATKRKAQRTIANNLAVVGRQVETGQLTGVLKSALRYCIT